MDNEKYNIRNQAEQFKMYSSEIDNLQAKVIKAKTGSGAEPVDQIVDQINELSEKIEIARNKLIQIFYSLKGQDNNE
jgi:hypothetical protein